MCTSLAEGGKRCVYADQLANVRHKARYKHRDLSPMMQQREVNKAVAAWRHNNSETVMNHLPETQPFQAKPNQKTVPQSLLQLLTPKRTPVVGLDDEARDKATKDLYEENQAWENSLTDNEANAMGSYAITSYILTNAILRRSGVSEISKKDGPVSEETIQNSKDRIKDLDDALKKAEHSTEIRKVYRYFKIPEGVTVKEYLERYFTAGEAFKDRGYMSTSTDPEFVAAAVHGNKKKHSKDKYIVMEILTRQGGSMQNRPYGSSGNIQSLEKEVLLPRNTKMRIVDTRVSHKFEFGSDRHDLHRQFNRGSAFHDDFSYQEKFKKGAQMSLPLIQLIDEKLISES